MPKNAIEKKWSIWKLIFLDKSTTFCFQICLEAKFAPEANLHLLPDFKMHFEISIFSYNFVFEGLILERKTYNM